MTPLIQSEGVVGADQSIDELDCPSCERRRLREACLPASLLRAQAVLMLGALSLTPIATTSALANSAGNRGTAASMLARGDDAPDLGGPTDELPDDGGSPDDPAASPELPDASPIGSSPAAPASTPLPESGAEALPPGTPADPAAGTPAPAVPASSDSQPSTPPAAATETPVPSGAAETAPPAAAPSDAPSGPAPSAVSQQGASEAGRPHRPARVRHRVARQKPRVKKTRVAAAPAPAVSAPAPAAAPPRSAPAPRRVTVTAAGAIAPVKSRPARPGSRTHVVASGESLWSIAADHLGGSASSAEIGREVERLWQVNRARIGTGSRDLLLAGTRLRLG
jgi:hypothetical protein